MRQKTFQFAALVLIVSIGILGCQQKPKSANSKEAIQQVQNLPTTDEKVRYLVKEANAFVSSKQFDDAINTAKYILSNLDKESTEAKAILQKAQEDLKKAAEAKTEELKAKMKEKMNL